MPKMCQHRVTKELWPYNGDLARHDDVEIVDVPDPQFATAVAAEPELTIGDIQEASSEPKPAPQKPKTKRTRRKKAASQPSAVGAEDTVEDDDPLADLELSDDA